MRSILGLVLGLTVAILTVWLLQMIGHTVWPLPEVPFTPKTEAHRLERLEASGLC